MSSERWVYGIIAAGFMLVTALVGVLWGTLSTQVALISQLQIQHASRLAVVETRADNTQQLYQEIRAQLSRIESRVFKGDR